MADPQLQEHVSHESNESYDQAVQEVYTFAAEQMANGASNAEVIASLMYNGLDQETASVVVGNLARERSKAIRKSSYNGMLLGAAIGGGALLFTAVSYKMASSGGTYYITYGAIFYGGYVLLKNLITYLKN